MRVALVLDGPRAASLAARLERALPQVEQALRSALLVEPEEEGFELVGEPVGAVVRAPVLGPGPSCVVEAQRRETDDFFLYFPGAVTRVVSEVPAEVLSFASPLTAATAGGGLARVTRAYNLGREAAERDSRGDIVAANLRAPRITAYAYLILSTVQNHTVDGDLGEAGPFWTRSRTLFQRLLAEAEASPVRCLFVGVDIGTFSEAEAFYRGAGYRGGFAPIRS